MRTFFCAVRFGRGAGRTGRGAAMGICGSKPAGEPKPTASGVNEGVPPPPPPPPDVRVGQCVLTLEEHSDAVNSACFSPDGAKIVTASSDNTVRVCNAATGECELTLKGQRCSELGVFQP
jgi:WD40 repeat protein